MQRPKILDNDQFTDRQKTRWLTAPVPGGYAYGLDRRFYEVQRAASKTGSSVHTLRKMIHEKELPALTFGGRYYVPREALVDLLDAAPIGRR